MVEKVHALTIRCFDDVAEDRASWWSELNRNVTRVGALLPSRAHTPIAPTGRSSNYTAATVTSVVAHQAQGQTSRGREAIHSRTYYGYYGLATAVPAWARNVSVGEGVKPLSESRMREIRKSGSMSGMWKRSHGAAI